MKTLEWLKKSGSYVLILRVDAAVQLAIQIGRLGELAAQPGYYLYIGSAFGPGGVAARVQRHLRLDKRQHWHIDYLRPYATPTAVWCTYDAQPREHLWASVCAQLPHVSRPMSGFGASDCHCDTHLFYSPHPPNAALFMELVDQAAAAHGEIQIWVPQNKSSAGWERIRLF